MQDHIHDHIGDGTPQQREPTTDRPVEADFEVGIAAFLPEGVGLAGEEDMDPAGGSDPSPVPGDGAAEPDGATGPDAPAAGFEAPQPEPEPEVDLELLGSLEDDLADVDAALAAIDSGDPGASPLLRRLLDGSAGPTPAAEAAEP